jgi:hypothetical protein
MTIPSFRGRGLAAQALLLALVLTLLSFAAFTSTGRDDPHLTYWIADRIREGLLNGYNGQPFEQTSSLLHALLIAAVMGLTGQIAPAAAKGLELLVSVAVLSFGFLLVARRRGRARATGAVLALALLPPFAYWSWGGLETSMLLLLALLQVGCLTLLLRHGGAARWALLVACNLAWVALRPEASLVLPLQLALLLAMAWFARRRQTGAQEAPAPLPLLAAVLLPIGFGVLIRLLLFGRPVPSTVLAKALWHASLADRISEGLRYVLMLNPNGAGLAGGLALLLLWLVGLVVCLRSASPLVRCLVCLATAQLVAAVLGGGDWMELGRFLMAPMALLWLGLCAEVGAGRLAWPGIALVSLLSAGFHLRTASSEAQAARFRLTTLAPFPAFGAPRPAAAVWFHGDSRPAMVQLPLASQGQGLCRWPWEALKAPNLRDCHFLAAVARAEGEKRLFSIHPGDILLSYQAGMVPYHLLGRYPQLRFIDSVGLASPERTSVPALALRGQGPGSPQVMLRFVQTYRPAFVFDLGESRRLLADQGYLPVVSVALRVRGIPYEEVFYVRADRLRPGS